MTYKCDECGKTDEEKGSCCGAEMTETEEKTEDEKEEPKELEEGNFEDEM